MEKYKVPQGTTGYPVIGNLLNLASSNRLDWFQSLNDRFGEISTFKVMKTNVYLVNHPEYVKEILTSKMPTYTKRTIGFKIIKVVLGESIFTASHDVWKRKRRIAQPYFHKKIISNLATIMTDVITEMLDKWEEKCDKGETVDIMDAMMRLTLDVVVRTLFSTALTKEELQKVADVFTPILQETNNRNFYPFKFITQLPLKRNKDYKENVETLNQIIFSIIEKRRTSKEKHMDLLQMLMDARDEETGEALSDQELRDEAMTIFIAGHETTANAMSWLWVVLNQEKEVRERLDKEIHEVLGKRVPTAADFPNLPYTLKVFKEILRVYPPVPAVPRRIEKDDKLGEYQLEGGNDVFISPYLLHRHPDFWEDPEKFDPNRFDKEKERQRHTFAYLPFGGGPRICMGNNFAMMEAVFIIAMTSQRFKLKLLPNLKIKPSYKLTYRPNKVLVKLERK